jgi:molecular chaperone Hsp33
MWLAADQNHAAGMLLQQLPAQITPDREERQAQWQHACALAALGGAELQDILDEQGSITMDCEFCNQQYIFRAEDVSPLLNNDETRTLH